MGTTIERNYGYSHEVNLTKRLDWSGGGGGGGVPCWKLTELNTSSSKNRRICSLLDITVTKKFNRHLNYHPMQSTFIWERNTNGLSSVTVGVSVVLKRTVGDSDWRFYNLSNSHLQSQSNIASSAGGIYVSGYWPDFNCHVIGCKTCKSWLVRFDPSIVPVSLLLVKLSVQSIVCLFWCR